MTAEVTCRIKTDCPSYPFHVKMKNVRTLYKRNCVGIFILTGSFHCFHRSDKRGQSIGHIRVYKLRNMLPLLTVRTGVCGLLCLTVQRVKWKTDNFQISLPSRNVSWSRCHSRCVCMCHICFGSLSLWPIALVKYSEMRTYSRVTN